MNLDFIQWAKKEPAKCKFVCVLFFLGFVSGFVFKGMTRSDLESKEIILAIIQERYWKQVKDFTIIQMR